MNKLISGLILLVFLLTGCCSEPWKVFPMSVAPDVSCRTGTTHGYDIYIWDCYQNEKVVISQYSTEATCQAPEQQKTKCGQLTEIERKLATEIREQCGDLPEFRRWKVTPVNHL